MASKKQIVRCEWCGDTELYQRYHDCEWGIPIKEDQQLFELLILEGAQAGLSWITVLKKREGYREAYDGFEVQRVSKFTARKMESLMKHEGIIRNRLKIQASVQNAKAFMRIQDEFGSFSSYQWNFVGGRPLQNHFKTLKEFPSRTELSDKFSKDLKNRGFKFVGSTIMYAYMQATGMVNDHVVGCHRYLPVKRLGASFRV